MPPIPQDLLEILVCPETHQPVRSAEAALVEKLEVARQAGSLKNRAGEVPADPIAGALVREDGKVAYIVVDDIPIMLIDEGIELEPLGA